LIAEPSTTLTDYALAALCATLADRLRGQASPAPLWAAGLGAVALAALLGGTSHGFAPSLSETTTLFLWFGTYVLIGLANLLMLCAALSTLPRPLRAALIAAALIKLGAYLVLGVARRDFAWVSVEMGLTLFGLLAIGVYRQRAGLPGAGWLLAGVTVSFAGALVQYARLAPHRYFNHNDLFHVVQMLAMILFYRAAEKA